MWKIKQLFLCEKMSCNWPLVPLFRNINFSRAEIGLKIFYVKHFKTCSNFNPFCFNYNYLLWKDNCTWLGAICVEKILYDCPTNFCNIERTRNFDFFVLICGVARIKILPQNMLAFWKFVRLQNPPKYNLQSISDLAHCFSW